MQKEESRTRSLLPLQLYPDHSRCMCLRQLPSCVAVYLLKDGLQIVHFYQSIAHSVVHTAYDRGVVSRWQRSNDGRLAWLSRSMPTVLDRANLVGGDDPGDYGSLPVVIRGNQRPCTVMQFQCRISQYIGNPKRSELRTNGTQNHRLCLAALDNEPANHHVV